MFVPLASRKGSSRDVRWPLLSGIAPCRIPSSMPALLGSLLASAVDGTVAAFPMSLRPSGFATLAVLSGGPATAARVLLTAIPEALLTSATWIALEAQSTAAAGPCGLRGASDVGGAGEGTV